MADALPLVVYGDIESRVKALEDDGYVYLPGVLDTGEIAALRESMERLEAIPENYDRSQTPKDHGFLNKCINNAFNRDILYLQYLDRPDIIEVEEAVHGDECHVIGMTAWLTGPGRPHQSLHIEVQ